MAVLPANTGKVSVIVPVYNAEKYLKECLESIAGQDYSDLEILLVNDGSTDNSGSIAQSYQDKDARFRSVRKTAARLLPGIMRCRYSPETMLRLWMQMIGSSQTLSAPSCTVC